jgi:peptidoglycan/LPS O-acetylase OafA/YrhL
MHHAFGAWHIMFQSWSGHEPYSEAITLFPPVAFGFLAVWLFFFISGYVIFTTLQRCSSFWEFMMHRWLRLFPAMLVCSALVFVTAPLFPERPFSAQHISDLLPGLTFIEPSWWAHILGRDQGTIEGAFWSLYTEMRFYVIFGIAYFLLGGKGAIRVLFGLFVVGLYIRGHHSLPILERIHLYRTIGHRVDTGVSWSTPNLESRV